MLDLGKIPSLGAALRDATTSFKSREALIEADRHRENGRMTYAQLRAAADRFTGALQAHGFLPGDRCAILMQNQSKWIVGATGALWAGATLVPLDYKLTAPEQAALVAHCKPRVLFTEWPTWEKLSHESAAVFERVLVVVSEAPEGARIGKALRFEALADKPATYHERQRDDLACIVYSSGTGGTPKGCMLSHANYLAQAEVLGRMYPMKDGERYFSVLPTNHAIDFMCGFLIPLIMGAAVVHQRTLRPAYLGPTMQRYGVTHMALVPTILKTLEKKIRERLDDLPKWQRFAIDQVIDLNAFVTRREPNHKLSSALLRPIHDQFGGKLKFMFCGGAFVERGCAEFLNRLGLPVAIGYGLTEAGTVLTVNDLKPFRGDSVGKPVPGVELQLRDENDAGVGEVWVRGPTVMQGYLDEPELTREAIVDGWLRTGDLGTIDAAGHLKLVGRAKNMIVTEGGKNVYPEDIEAAFAGIDDCDDYAVFASNYLWPSGKLGEGHEQLVIVVRPKPGVGDEQRAALITELRTRNRRLADYKRLSGYLLWEPEFPRTASQKLKREPLAVALRARVDRDAVRAL
ncbi:MAG: AMP-binding protein [Nannocystis sp.]|uniref:class I adenylate-forming enzyme family protein n=1 Tax=Nannocystis sp. TaxID=1962667 RepID=UPI0024208472|nr:AMP-binding protein [Nannocystis sp.]MBK9757305.1 AMP-binding protein [Nannocystis sp.]